MQRILDQGRGARGRWAAALGLAMLLAATGAPDARADGLRLDNGDVLHGEVIGGDERALKFKHVSGAEMTIPYGKIAVAETDREVEVKVLDGSRYRGKLAVGPKLGTITVNTQSVGPIAIEQTKIAAVNEPPESALWTGRLSIGATIVDGNSKSKGFFGSFDGERRTKSDRIEAHAFYAYAESRDPATRQDNITTRKSFFRIQYSYYVHRPLYLYAGGALEYDRFQSLELRSRGGGGFGLAAVEQPGKALRFEGGVEYVNEDYRPGLEDKAFTVFRLAAHADYQATSWLKVGESIEVLPNVEDFDDLFLRSTTSANFELGGGFGLAVVIIWEHDQIPSSPDRNKNDTTYAITLTYSF